MARVGAPLARVVHQADQSGPEAYRRGEGREGRPVDSGRGGRAARRGFRRHLLAGTPGKQHDGQTQQTTDKEPGHGDLLCESVGPTRIGCRIARRKCVRGLAFIRRTAGQHSRNRVGRGRPHPRALNHGRKATAQGVGMSIRKEGGGASPKMTVLDGVVRDYRETILILAQARGPQGGRTAQGFPPADGVTGHRGRRVVLTAPIRQFIGPLGSAGGRVLPARTSRLRSWRGRGGTTSRGTRRQEGLRRRAVPLGWPKPPSFRGVRGLGACSAPPIRREIPGRS